MNAPQAGEPAPKVTLTGPDGAVSLPDASVDGPLALLFFQEAGTPGCDAQLRRFRDDYDLLHELGARLVAISTDSPAAQERFRDTLAAPFPLLSDPDGGAARAYGVYDEASRRANRAVFVIDAAGVVRLALPWYSPQSSEQFQQVFAALGLEPGAGF